MLESCKCKKKCATLPQMNSTPREELINSNEPQLNEEDTRKIAALFVDCADEFKSILDVSHSSLEAGVLHGSDELIEKIISPSPPPQKQVQNTVELFLDLLSRQIFGNDEILEAFAKFICSAGANPFYAQKRRHDWFSTLAKHLTQRMINDTNLKPLFWVYYGRSQLVLSRDYFAEERVSILQKAIEVLSSNIHDTDTRTMIGILKAEIYVNSMEPNRSEWTEIAGYFKQQGYHLDSQLHYALCLARRILTEPNDGECYSDVLRLLGSPYLTECDDILAKAKTDLWWRECVLTIQDVCVRTTILLKGDRDKFVDQLNDSLRKSVVETVQQMEAPSNEQNEDEDSFCHFI